MNYIKHQTNVFALMDKVTSFKPYHISLYLVLFRMWNANRFENPISISRSETMNLARIGSPNTYVQALKDLHKHKFIRYDPSFDKTKGSLIILYRFDTISCTPSVSKMSPSINIKTIHSIKEDENFNSNQKNDDMKNPNISHLNDQTSQHPLVGDDLQSAPQNQQHPPLHHIQIYFQSKGHPIEEAERFFNYYESNGWLVGGRSKMKDWKAAARNWILNTKRFISRTSTEPGRSPSSNNRNPSMTAEPIRSCSQNSSKGNYSEPL
nr:hypothetical protein [uncultured Carboxylicivirga sp.]